MKRRQFLRNIGIGAAAVAIPAAVIALPERAARAVHHYELRVPWDISTAVFRYTATEYAAVTLGDSLAHFPLAESVFSKDGRWWYTIVPIKDLRLLQELTAKAEAQRLNDLQWDAWQKGTNVRYGFAP